MNLAEKWEEFRKTIPFKGVAAEYFIEQAQRAFYAGAEACNQLQPGGEALELQAEIDRFKGQK